MLRSESCVHEEANIRMLLHVREALLNGSHMKKLTRTSYSDDLVLVVSSITQLQGLKELWLAF